MTIILDFTLKASQRPWSDMSPPNSKNTFKEIIHSAYVRVSVPGKHVDAIAFGRLVTVRMVAVQTKRAEYVSKVIGEKGSIQGFR